MKMKQTLTMKHTAANTNNFMWFLAHILFFLKCYLLLNSNHHPKYEIKQKTEADTC